MTKQQRRKHRQEILSEIGKDWVPKEKAMLVSYGTRKLGMSKTEAENLAQFTKKGKMPQLCILTVAVFQK